MSDSPNVLWISTHDINPDLGCYRGVWPGAEYAITPCLDRLAAQGMRYDNAFATAPVCAPARSSIMTGCFPTSIGTMHMRSKAVPPPEVHLLSEYFRRAGYYCTNNWFTDFQVEVPPTAFDDCSERGHWRNRPSQDTPFFALFHSGITHESQLYLGEQEFLRRTSHVTPEQRHDPARVPLPPYYPDLPEFRIAWARYGDLITEMDHWVGGILSELEEDGLAGNTIVVFWSDHGKGMPRAKRWPNEAGLREPLLLRWPGRVAAGTVRPEIVHTMDLAPTMLAMAGLPVPDHMQGVPLIESQGRIDPHPNDYVYAGRDRMDEAEDQSRTVRDQRFRYIRHFQPERPAMIHTEYPDRLAMTWAAFRRLAAEEGRQQASGERPGLMTPLQRSVVAQRKPFEELYDIVDDPHETRNLASDSRYRAELERLRRALHTWRETRGDLGDVPESELVESWRPGGQRQRTVAPEVSWVAGRVAATCATPGASIGWTTEPPARTRPHTEIRSNVGQPQDDGRHWQVYVEPLDVEPGRGVWLRAWRLGYAPSTEVEVASDASDPVV